MPSPLPSSDVPFHPPLGANWRGPPSQLLPLQGLTILTVEDSRFACEAMRLICQRAGARLRRAETLTDARAHLRVYLPHVVIVDLGLPDGPGEALIRSLVMSGKQRPAVILGTSGDPSARMAALAAGADGFLEKPLQGVAELCNAVRQHLHVPEPAWTDAADQSFFPDPLALRDDLSWAADILAGATDHDRRRYVSRFLGGVARHANDTALAVAASQAVQDGGPALDALRSLIDSRLSRKLDEFRPEQT